MHMKKMLWIICITLAVVILPAQKVIAMDSVETENKGSLTIDFQLQEGFGESLEFSLYHVADISENGDFSFRKDFVNYPVEINHLDSEGWLTAAETLLGYAQRDKIKPSFSGKTDEEGKVIFSNMPLGLYLADVVQYETETHRFESIPFLVSLPNQKTLEDGWVYDVYVTPKYEVQDIEKSMITRKVKKLWNDQGKETYRPKNITVQLLCDGEIYDVINLSEENNWQHIWSNLEAGHIWTVVENEERGYLVTSFREMDTFVINNTASDIPPDQNLEDTTDSSDEQESIPNTGQLWWPVPLLFVAGLFCLIVGTIRSRNGEK